MQHGGDIVSYQHLYPGQIIDFSSNINPRGYPKIVEHVIANGLDRLKAYPDIQYRSLRQAIAEYLNCQADEVIVGNGAVEIIDYFCRHSDRIVVCIPCFSEYTERAYVHQKQVLKIPLPDDFRLRTELLREQIAPGDVLMLGNPNNPPGLRIHKAELLRIQQFTEERNAFLVLDEAFFEFCREDYDSIQLFYGKRNVGVIRAATKFFGLPGLRLGYAYAPPQVISHYNNSTLPWRVNAIADLAGRVIFRDKDYIRKSKQSTEQQRQDMFSQLETIDGITVYPTDTNFILLKLWHCTEDDLFERLIQRGLLIRKASSFEGLDNTYIRIAIKDQNSNTRLLNALREELSALHVSL